MEMLQQQQHKANKSNKKKKKLGVEAQSKTLIMSQLIKTWNLKKVYVSKMA